MMNTPSVCTWLVFSLIKPDRVSRHCCAQRHTTHHCHPPPSFSEQRWPLCSSLLGVFIMKIWVRFDYFLVSIILKILNIWPSNYHFRLIEHPFSTSGKSRSVTRIKWPPLHNMTQYLRKCALTQCLTHNLPQPLPWKTSSSSHPLRPPVKWQVVYH